MWDTGPTTADYAMQMANDAYRLVNGDAHRDLQARVDMLSSRLSHLVEQFEIIRTRLNALECDS